VTVGTAYYYTVSAVNAGGASGQSSEVSAAAQAIPPPAPTNVSAKRKSSKKSLVKWKQSTGANVTKNRIYRSTSQSGPWTLLTEIPAAKKYTDSTPVKGTAYYYTVTAVTGAGAESTRSNSAFAKAK
jgi:fibronectin type 3 domain-containing protein